MGTTTAMGLGTNRVLDAIEAMRTRLNALDTETLRKLDAVSAITEEEHAAYQDWKSLAQANGHINHNEAETVYACLGGTYNCTGNGGWAPRAGLAERMVVTQLMAELK